MKKLIIITFLFVLSGATGYSFSLNGFSEQFIRKFQNCEPYTESVSFNANGAVYHDKKQIDGWFGDFCAYKQTIKTSSMTLYAVCAFTREQVGILYNALLIQPKILGWDTETQNIWDKYVLDKQNCTLSGRNIYGKGIQVDKKYLPNF